MMIRKSLALFAVGGALAAPAVAQHAQVSAVAANPTNSSEVWVANRGNDSVSVIDTTTGTLVQEIAVGVWPRSLAFSADGSIVFVANQRGDIPVDVSFITPFTGTEIRDSVSVIDTASKTVTATLTGVGTEPYGIAVAPNGAYFAVTKRFLQNRCDLDNAHIAVALERFRLKHGKYPQRLAQLSPEFLEKVPPDPITEEDRIYRLRRDGTPVVYSVGLNREDDAGSPNRRPEYGDWVWQYSLPEGFDEKAYRARPEKP